MGDSDLQQEKTASSRWPGFVQIGTIFIVICVVIFFARAPEREYVDTVGQSSQISIVPTATVIQPTETTAAHKLALTGTVITLGTVSMQTEASGEVVWVSEKLRTGGSFTANEPLLQIDKTDYELVLNSARIHLRAAQAYLLKKQHKGQYRAAEFKRTRPGVAVPPWVSRDADIERAKARVEHAKDAIARAGLGLKRTTFSLPFDGYVVLSNISVGQMVTKSGLPIGSAFPKNQLQVQAQISTLDLNSLSPAIGRSAVVRADGLTYKAEVERVSQTVDIATRLASLFLSISDQESALLLPRPGAFVDVVVEGPVHENIFVLPEGVTQINGSVWLVDDGRLQRLTPTSLGYTDDGWLVKSFGTKQGVVIGQVSGARLGLAVSPIDAPKD